MNSFKDSSEL